ncbi:probable WRKY transcription factor 2 [Zingiber officinale]|uniref:probable WRKY transcription factor 2 n=1 Tax=Zingiber officinale TaxID=94328 RepID=UPI001C4D5785|nr:probable WRKY transcription factor 2 [Zingiber officinale]
MSKIDADYEEIQGMLLMTTRACLRSAEQRIMDNVILPDNSYAQMMRTNELIESEQYALAMVSSENTQREEHNNNNENQLENEVVGVNVTPLLREVSEAIGNPPSDGYNWRKYGQKKVKGNKFPRSYYKCTYPDCKAKKKVEYSDEGYAAEIIYKEKHDHPQANPSRDLVSIYLAQEMTYNLNKEDDNDSRKRKLDQYVATAQMSSSSRSARQQKWVAKMVSHHNVVDDGYRWQKYGQKVVKGNSEPRNYYKCTHPGCIVKKHIERAVDDCNILLTTYEGNHNHDIVTTNNIDNNLNFTTADFSFDHHNQANNLQLEARVEAATTANQEERFMRFECPNRLNTIRPRTVSVEQCPRPNLGFQPIVMPYVGLPGTLESNVGRIQELNASFSRTQLPMRANIPRGYDMTMKMTPSQSRRM